MHSVSAVRLVELEWVPAGHGRAALAPVGQKEPGSHARQLSMFALGWYVPPSHSAHSMAPVVPV